MIILKLSNQQLIHFTFIPFPFQPERYIYQSNQCRNFYQRPDDTCKGLPGMKTENPDSYGNGQFEVVSRSSERQGCIFGIISTQFFS